MRIRQVLSQSKESDEPNVAPLIDIVFILLIFFVVTTTFTKDLGIAITRPKANSASEQPTQVVRVAIGRRGEITVDGRSTSPWRLEDEVRDRISHYVDKSALLVADKDIDAQKLVEIMDICRRAGASQLAVAVEEMP